MVYQTEKILSENRDKVPEEEAKQIDHAISEAKKALQESDIQAVRNAREVLEKASHRLAEVMYQKVSPQPESESGGGTDTGGEQQAAAGGPGSDDDVIDAEIVEPEEDEKK
jgi:molecular chaperone DnaK